MTPREAFRKRIRDDYKSAALDWYRRTGQFGIPSPDIRIRVHPNYADPETGEVNGAEIEYRHIEVDVGLGDETLPADPDTPITRERKRQERGPYDWLWGLLAILLILYCGISGFVVLAWGFEALVLAP